MSSLAAARADNFYYPPDFDPKQHGTLNKYNGQHPLRERASKLDQGILVIRFEIPFNIWCEKCGEHIAKGERFNAEKKAIGQYHSTKILQFTMTHHCGCKITIQTDPKRAEYLVIEGAKKKEETYSAADAEVIELPDEAEREKRERDPLYRLEYQQGAKAKALTEAERLAAIQDAVDARTADPYSLNRVMRAALRGEKRDAAALDSRRVELGLPEEVSLLAASEGDALAAQVAFLTSSARAMHCSKARRKHILEQDIFLAGQGADAAGPGKGPVYSSSKRPALSVMAPPPIKIRLVGPAARAAVEVQAEKVGTILQAPPALHQRSATQVRNNPPQHHQKQGQQQEELDQTLQEEAARLPLSVDCGSSKSRQELPAQRSAFVATLECVPPLHLGCSGASGSALPVVMPSSRKLPPGAAALALAAARAADLAQAPRCSSIRVGTGRLQSGLSHVSMRSGLVASGVFANAGTTSVASKRSLRDRATELRRRRQAGKGPNLLGS